MRLKEVYWQKGWKRKRCMQNVADSRQREGPASDFLACFFLVRSEERDLHSKLQKTIQTIIQALEGLA